MKEEQSINNKASLAIYRSAITRYLRSQMIVKGIKYEDLVMMLEEKGVQLTSDNLRSKFSKGMLAGDLLIAVIEVLKLDQSAISEILRIKDDQTPSV